MKNNFDDIDIDLDNDTDDEQESYIDDLLSEFKEQRNSLKEMINDLEDLKKNLNGLFPDNLNARYKHFFEEKLRVATELFKTILDIRKEISKSLKDEIDLRRKTKSNGTLDSDIENYIDMSEWANKLSGLKKEKAQKLKNVSEKLMKKTKEN